MKLSLGPVVLSAVLAVGAFGCASASEDNTSSDESNLDTSGCSGLDASQTEGAISVSAQRPPTASCWNVDTSGLSVSYSWNQKNNATPEKTNIGFYVALNGGDDFQKADATFCREASGGVSMGHDTSGDRYFTCTASKRFSFRDQPELKSAAYGADGHRLAWNVQVAVSLDDGRWDSLDGANYHFSF